MNCVAPCSAPAAVLHRPDLPAAQLEAHLPLAMGRPYTVGGPTRSRQRVAQSENGRPSAMLAGYEPREASCMRLLGGGSTWRPLAPEQ